MKKMFGYFMKGLLVTAPVAITIYIVWIILAKIDDLLPALFGKPSPIPGVGILAVFFLITLAGFLASGIFSRWLVNLINNIFNRLPLVKLLYNSLKDLIGAFVGDKKMFDKPVLVKLYPESETKVLGFITRESLDFLGVREHVAVYLPQSYNFSGNLMVVHRNQVTPVNKDSTEVMTFIISAGISGK